MRNIFVVSLLFLVGCATAGVSREVVSQQRLLGPVGTNSPGTSMVQPDRIIRLVDSRMIREQIRQSRKGDALSLVGWKRVAAMAGLAYAILYLLTGDDDPEPCALGDTFCQITGL